MKFFYLFVFIFSTSLVSAQENTKASPPVIVAKIPLGETVVFESTAITFKSVIEDSRCPTDVTCVWEGQAKVLVALKSNGLTVEKELLFRGTDFGSESENTLLVTDLKKYIGYRLSPYPVSSQSLAKRDYKLEIYSN